VDTKTEVLIARRWDRLLEGRTALVIAHALSTIQHAESNSCLPQGKLREQGSHQELLACAGFTIAFTSFSTRIRSCRASFEPAENEAGASLPGND